jgi:hypothetical protein
MRARIFIIALVSTSLLSFGAYARHGAPAPAPGKNAASISQSGKADTAGIGQTAGPNSSNAASISQSGKADLGVTSQSAWGGMNSSTTAQSGSHDVAVTSQSAF